ncbi:MAG: hypothetical protein V3R72_06945 [Gammaproteobacteria bacterium]
MANAGARASKLSGARGEACPGDLIDVDAADHEDKYYVQHDTPEDGI